MPNPALVVITAAAQEAAKSFGEEMANGVLEALLHQKKIKEQLELINKKLDWIIGFLVHEFPEIMKEALKNDRIESYEIDIETRWESLADFSAKRENILLLKQGILDISAATRSIAKYLPGTYAQVCFGFLCILAVFDMLAEIDETEASDIVNFARSFEEHLRPALEEEGSKSLLASLKRLTYELSLANTCVPLLGGIGGRGKEFLVSYSSYPDGTIAFNGVSLQRITNTSNNGRMSRTRQIPYIEASLPKLLQADGPHGMAIAPWWPVQQANSGDEMNHKYNHFTSEMNRYCQIFDKNPEKIHALQNIISSVEATMKAIAIIKNDFPRPTTTVA